MVYNPGTALSDEWRNYFFVTSFPGESSNARIYGFRLKEDGAGVTYEDEKLLLRGVLAIGMRFGAEGALYLTDWMTGWNSKDKGRIWKLDAPAAAGSAARKEVQTLLRADFRTRPVAGAGGAPAPRRHARPPEGAVRAGAPRRRAPLAGDGARRVGRPRPAARDLGHRADGAPPALACAAAGGVPRRQRRRSARAGGEDDWRRPLRRPPATGWCRCSTIPRRACSSSPPKRSAASRTSRRSPRWSSMLAENDDHDVYLRHAGSLALASIGDAPALEALAQHESAAVRLAAVIALRRMRHAGVARFLADADERVVTDAARAINDDGGIDGGAAGAGRGR